MPLPARMACYQPYKNECHAGGNVPVQAIKSIYSLSPFSRYSTFYETLCRVRSQYFHHFLRIDETSGKVLLYHRNFVVNLLYSIRFKKKEESYRNLGKRASISVPVAAPVKSRQLAGLTRDQQSAQLPRCYGCSGRETNLSDSF